MNESPDLWDRGDLAMTLRHRLFIRHLQGFCVKDHDDCPYCETEANDA